MSPNAPCPKCGTIQPFHKKEMKGVRKGEVLCVECSMEREFYIFLAEVIDGEHPELIAELRRKLEEEADEPDIYL